MANAPTQEELEAARKELADLQAENSAVTAEKESDAAATRRQAEWDRLQSEIAFAKQANAILTGTPPEPDEGETNTPPDNAAVPDQPASPSNTQLGDDDEDGE